MKNFIPFLLMSFFVITIHSCSEEDVVIGKANWEFTIKTITSTSPAVTGYPQTTITTITQNDLTSAEADKVVTQYTSTVTQSQYVPGFGTLTVTIKTTCTKQKIS